MKRRACSSPLSPVHRPLARAHHGWSSFDQDRPLYLEGRVARVRWQNPHAELHARDGRPGSSCRPTWPARACRRRAAPVDGRALLRKAALPTRKDRRLGDRARAAHAHASVEGGRDPARRHGVGGRLSAPKDEKGEPVLRAEYLFVDGKAYGLRSSPA